jgi:hypothetical protein
MLFSDLSDLSDHDYADPHQGERQSRQASDDRRPSVRPRALQSKPGNPVNRSQNQEAEDDRCGAAWHCLYSLIGYFIPACPIYACTGTKLILPTVWHRSSFSLLPWPYQDETVAGDQRAATCRVHLMWIWPWGRVMQTGAGVSSLRLWNLGRKILVDPDHASRMPGHSAPTRFCSKQDVLLAR